MKPVDRQKVCTHCDGRIRVEAKECIYCGTEQIKTSPSSFKQAPAAESLSPVYAPLYSAKSSSSIPIEEPQKKETARTATNGDGKTSDVRSDFYLVLFLMSASTLLTLGLVQFFFSEGGELRLEWNSRYWFLYCLAAIPLFYLGWKRMGSLKDASSDGKNPFSEQILFQFKEISSYSVHSILQDLSIVNTVVLSQYNFPYDRKSGCLPRAHSEVSSWIRISYAKNPMILLGFVFVDGDENRELKKDWSGSEGFLPCEEHVKEGSGSQAQTEKVPLQSLV